jgi:hypothetical protein
VARLRGGTLPEQLHAVLFLALEKTGTLAAESGLASALTNRGLSLFHRETVPDLQVLIGCYVRAEELR